MATCNASIARPRGGVAIRDLDVTRSGVYSGRQVGEGVRM